MLGTFAAMACSGLVALYAYRWLRQGGSVLVPVLATLSLVALIPTQLVYVRIVATVASLCFCVKLVELGAGRVHEPAMLERLDRFFFWFLLPPDSRPPRDHADAAKNRAAGWRRIGRGTLKAAGCGALLQLDHAFDIVGAGLLLSTQWSMWLVYLAFSGLADAVSGLFMQTGNWVAESFHAPVLARSPRDFWGQRWNMVIHRFAQRNLFMRFGGKRHPLRAMAIIFAASGAMHEYFIVAVKGEWSDHAGWMMAFFVLHGAAVIVQVVLARATKVPRLPRPVAIGLHFVWMSVTAPLFITPLSELF